MTTRKAATDDTEEDASETAEMPDPVDTETPSGTSGSVTLVYRGPATKAIHGAYEFRPGQPVTVPSDVAEELLTYPHQTFEVREQE